MRLWLLVVIAVAGCGTDAVPTAHQVVRQLPVGAISGITAIEIARSAIPATAAFVSATAGNRAGFVPADPELLTTWIVKFTGDFPMQGCAPGGTCRPRLSHHATVFLDLFTGEFITAEVS